MEVWKTVQDKNLIDWLRSGGEDTRELIVQVKTPPRKIPVVRRPNGRTHFLPVKKSDTSARDKAINGLVEALENVVDKPPVILRSAGAVAVKATSRQVLCFVNHPLVKAIYPNRHLVRGAHHRSRLT